MEKLQSKTTLSSDEELIAKIIEGEPALFEILIRRYNPLLYKIARSQGLNHQDAEDMMQETHFSAYQQLKNFRHEASYKTWLTRIHLHKCYHKLNRGYHRHESTVLGELTEQTQPMHSAHQDTEKTVLNRELAQSLERSVQKLPLIYRNVFVLRELESFSVAETADLLGITAVNVKVRLNRARALLQKELETLYSRAEIFEFNLKYCDAVVQRVFQQIATMV